MGRNKPEGPNKDVNGILMEPGMWPDSVSAIHTHSHTNTNHKVSEFIVIKCNLFIHIVPLRIKIGERRMKCINQNYQISDNIHNSNVQNYWFTKTIRLITTLVQQQ